MSGPWDRPSSDDPDDWPSEDLGRSGAWNVEGGREPSFARDPGSEGAPGWDDWPSPPPPADDYLTEEPLRPSSDPWAESWTAEEADAMIGAASGEPVAPESPAPLSEEPTFQPAEPDWRLGPSQPQPIRADEPAPGADHEPVSRIEPWSPDPDPWRVEPDEPPSIEPASPAEAYVEAHVDPAVESEPEPAPLSEPEVEAAPEPSAWRAPVARWPARSDDLPDWLAEPLPDAESVDAAPVPEASQPEPITAAQAETEAQPPPPAGADEAWTPPMEADTEPPSTPEPEPTSVPFWKSILPWRSSDRDDDSEADVEAEPEAAFAPQADAPEADAPQADAPEADARQADAPHADVTGAELQVRDPEPRWPASLPEARHEPIVDEAAAEADADDGEDGHVPAGVVPLTGGLTYDSLEPWRTPDMAQAAEVAEPQAAPWREPEPEPETRA